MSKLVYSLSVSESVMLLTNVYIYIYIIYVLSAAMLGIVYSMSVKHAMLSVDGELCILIIYKNFTLFPLRYELYCLQCFDTVGWASGTASGL